MMNAKFVLAAILASFSLTAHAQFPDIKVKMTRVEGELYRCLQPGGGFALKTTPPQKIWQVDVNRQGEMSSDGLELDISKFNVFRCPHCYSFEAILKVDKQKLDYMGNMNFEGGKIKLNVNISQDGKGQDYSLPCTLVK